nr:MAG TPA: hypothetical protein [Caudoviricetes sp.]
MRKDVFVLFKYRRRYTLSKFIKTTDYKPR